MAHFFMKILLGLNGSIHSREFHPDGLDYFRLKKPGWTQACVEGRAVASSAAMISRYKKSSSERQKSVWRRGGEKSRGSTRPIDPRLYGEFDTSKMVSEFRLIEPV
jgi:hypothetical protein